MLTTGVVSIPAMKRTGFSARYAAATEACASTGGVLLGVGPIVGAFAAATLAGAPPMRTGIEAMRLGGVIHLLPFFFVINPALVGQASALELPGSMLGALAGIWFLAGALQGHVSLVGDLPRGAAGLGLRALLGAGGFVLALPGGGLTGVSHSTLAAVDGALALLPLATASIGRAIVAALPDAERDYLLRALGEREPDSFSRIEQGIRRACDELAAQGFCTSFGDWLLDVNTVAAPLLSLDGEHLHGLNAGEPSFLVPAGAECTGARGHAPQ